MYAWLITRDHLSNEEDRGAVGPRGCPLTSDEITAVGSRFRMLSDDGELYYEGLYAGPDDETLFAPLEDFGMPNAGATTIQYRNASGAWEAL